MLSARQKKLICTFAKKRARKNDRYHSISHLEEVASNAVMLAKKEGGNSDLCWASAMLHDICKSLPGEHGENGAKDARKFLSKAGVKEKDLEEICDAIRFHNKGFSRGPLTRKILWDADKLTVMGMHGFTRRLLPFWVWKKGLPEGARVSIPEYYFFEKRFKTKAAKKIVKAHSKKVHPFLNSLKKELGKGGGSRA